MNSLEVFLQANRAVSQKTENILPQAKPDLTTLYDESIIQTINSYKNPLVLDLGGGKGTSFVHQKTNHKYTLWVIDSDQRELADNKNADKLIPGDLNLALPLKSNSIDIIVSRYTLEHLKKPEALIKEGHRILKKGGAIIILFSCRFALFAFLNRIFPANLSKFFLNHLVLGSRGTRGFKPYYNNLYYSKIIQIFTNSGFKTQHLYFSYYQSRYYTFFFPLYLISIFYEFILKLLDLKDMSAYILIKATK